jgi:hypothetical protein
MKTLNIALEDSDFDRLEKAKLKYSLRSWHSFIMLLAKPGLLAKHRKRGTEHESRKTTKRDN